MTSPPAERRHDIDALRVIAVLFLLVYHCVRPFDLEPWHVKNAEVHLGFQLFGAFFTVFRLPLLFMISGAGTAYALGVRSAGAYAAERLRRLLLPLVVGMLVVVPPQVYVERVGTWMRGRQSPLNFHGSFLDFYPHYFSGIYPHGNFSWHHLWFLAYLLVYSLLALPLFVYLRTGPGRRARDRAVVLLSGRWAIFLPALALSAVHIALRGRFPPTHALIGDWWNVVHYLVLFVLGYVLVADARFGQAAERSRHTALVLFAILTPLRLTLLALGLAAPPRYSWAYAGLLTLRGCTEWVALLAVIGYGYRYLNRPSRWLRWAGPRVYPFYIWHQTVIVLLAFVLIRAAAPPLVKCLILVPVSLVITLALCHAVGLTSVTRAMFGMRSSARGGPALAGRSTS